MAFQNQILDEAGSLPTTQGLALGRPVPYRHELSKSKDLDTRRDLGLRHVIIRDDESLCDASNIKDLPKNKSRGYSGTNVVPSKCFDHRQLTVFKVYGKSHGNFPHLGLRMDLDYRLSNHPSISSWRRILRDLILSARLDPTGNPHPQLSAVQILKSLFWSTCNTPIGLVGAQISLDNYNVKASRISFPFPLFPLFPAGYKVPVPQVYALSIDHLVHSCVAVTSCATQPGVSEQHSTTSSSNSTSPFLDTSQGQASKMQDRGKRTSGGDEGPADVKTGKKRIKPTTGPFFGCPYSQVYYLRPDLDLVPEEQIKPSCDHCIRTSAAEVKAHVKTHRSDSQKVGLDALGKKKPSETEEQLVRQLYGYLFGLIGDEVPEIYILPRPRVWPRPREANGFQRPPPINPQVGTHPGFESESRRLWVQTEIRPANFLMIDWGKHEELLREFKNFRAQNSSESGDSARTVSQFLFFRAGGQDSGLREFYVNQAMIQVRLFDEIREQNPERDIFDLLLLSCVRLELLQLTPYHQDSQSVPMDQTGSETSFAASANSTMPGRPSTLPSTNVDTINPIFLSLDNSASGDTQETLQEIQSSEPSIELAGSQFPDFTDQEQEANEAKRAVDDEDQDEMSCDILIDCLNPTPSAWNSSPYDFDGLL